MTNNITDELKTGVPAADPIPTMFQNALQSGEEFLYDDSTELSAIPGWDSFGHVRLVMEIETYLDRRLEMDEIVAIASVADVRALLSGKA